MGSPGGQRGSTGPRIASRRTGSAPGQSPPRRVQTGDVFQRSRPPGRAARRRRSFGGFGFWRRHRRRHRPDPGQSDLGDKGCPNLSGTFFGAGCNTKSSDDFHGNDDVEHNPFRYFSSFKTLCKDISPFDRLFPELDSADPPAYNFVVADLDNGGGDNGTMSSGDTWLSAKLPKIMQTKWYQQGGQIVIMYDTGYEDGGGVNGSSGLRIPLEVVSAHTKGMGLVDRPLNTAGGLRSLEHPYGVSYLGDAAKAANGSLGRPVVSDRPTGAVPARSMDAAVIRPGAKPTVTKSTAALAFSGIARTASGLMVEVGENGHGQGVVATAAHGSSPCPAPATSNRSHAPRPASATPSVWVRSARTKGCWSRSSPCVLAGTSTIGKSGYSGGTLATYAYGRAGAAKAVPCPWPRAGGCGRWRARRSAPPRPSRAATASARSCAAGT